MTVEFALDFIPKRMRELEYGTDFFIRWRHMVIQPGTTIVDSSNEYYFLIQPSKSVQVRSKSGICNLNDNTITEMQYEHRGKIFIKNLTATPTLILFIQVIPKYFEKFPK